MGEVVPIQRDDCARVSGNEMPHGSTAVWALDITAMPGKKAHFWRRHRNGYERECDGYVAPAFLRNGQATLFGAGNYPKCKRCMTRLTKASPE